MTDLPRKPLGRSGVSVTVIGIGTSPLASMPQLYGYPVSESQAIDTIDAALNSPIRFVDTSNGYGANGSAERRIGAALRRHGGLPLDMVLATKVDPDPATGDFSADRVRNSLEESLDRLGVDQVELLHLHDPERISFATAMAAGGPVDALIRLRDEGLVHHLGVAGGPVALLRQYLDTGVFDVLLSHNRYTLLDQSAAALFADAHERGIGVLNAAPYGGGMLSRGPDQRTTYAYGQRNDAIGSAAAAMARVAAAAGVPLAGLALNFSLRAPFVDSTLVGMSSPERVRETVTLAQLSVDAGIWDELDRLAPPPELWLDPP